MVFMNYTFKPGDRVMIMEDIDIECRAPEQKEE